jgi:chromosome partitioning protein
MHIALLNFKGGVGKSLIAHQMICCFDFFGVELDLYGNLNSRLPEKTIKVKHSLPNNLPENVIFDCGGFDDKLVHEVIKVSDIIVVPFVPSFEAVQTTILTLNTLKAHLLQKKIVFVSNMATKNSMLKEALKAFEAILHKDVVLFSLPHLQSFQTAINENTSVLALAKKNKVYSKAAEMFEELYTILKQV